MWSSTDRSCPLPYVPAAAAGGVRPHVYCAHLAVPRHLCIYACPRALCALSRVQAVADVVPLPGRVSAVKVLPGARIPTDGEVVEGTSYVDESMLTGESGALPADERRRRSGGMGGGAMGVGFTTCQQGRLAQPGALQGLPADLAAHLPLSRCLPCAAPVHKQPGVSVFGGTVNMGGALRVRASRQGGQGPLRIRA